MSIQTASATPGLDAIAKKDLTSKLKLVVDKASRATDKAEDFLAMGRKGKWTLKVTREVEQGFQASVKTATNAAYEMLDLLRPAISSRELEAIKGIDLDVAKQATMLIEGLQRLDKQHYGPLLSMRAGDMLPYETVQAIHALWSQMDLVEKVYTQFRAAFWG